jgi:hypothetical protein
MSSIVSKRAILAIKFAARNSIVSFMLASKNATKVRANNVKELQNYKRLAHVVLIPSKCLQAILNSDKNVKILSRLVECLAKNH